MHSYQQMDQHLIVVNHKAHMNTGELTSPAVSQATDGTVYQPYLLALAFALCWGVVWTVACGLLFANQTGLWTTMTGAICLWLVAVSSYTDLRWFRIPNWLTYSAALCGLLINFVLVWLLPAERLGAVGMLQAAGGFIVLFIALLVIFSLTGGGAGDVKLAAALGSLLGLELGLEAILVSFVCAGVLAILRGIWSYGPLGFLDLCCRPILAWLMPLWVDQPDATARRKMRDPLPLAPSFALGVLFVLAGYRIEEVTGWLGM